MDECVCNTVRHRSHPTEESVRKGKTCRIKDTSHCHLEGNTRHTRRGRHSVGVHRTEWVSRPNFEGGIVSVGQGRVGREVPSKEHDPRRADVRGERTFQCAYPGEWCRESRLCIASCGRKFPRRSWNKFPKRSFARSTKLVSAASHKTLALPSPTRPTQPRVQSPFSSVPSTPPLSFTVHSSAFCRSLPSRSATTTE